MHAQVEAMRNRLRELNVKYAELREAKNKATTELASAERQIKQLQTEAKNLLATPKKPAVKKTPKKKPAAKKTKK